MIPETRSGAAPAEVQMVLGETENAVLYRIDVPKGYKN